MTIPSEKTRLWIYGIVASSMVILAGRGIITQEEAPLWLELTASVLGVGGASVAITNRTSKTASINKPPN